MKQKLLSLLLALTLVLSLSIPALAMEIPGESDDYTGAVVIIHTNDSHGRITSDGQAGFAAVSAVKKAFEEAGAAVLLLDAGDTLHGLPIATINQGADVVAVLNAVGYDAFTPGNHDFNYGTDRLLELETMMDFPLVSANVVNNATNESLFTPSIIIEKGGITFGIVGLATPETAYKTNPKNVETVTFASPIEAAKEQVALLKANEDVDCILVLGHIGVDASSEFTADKIAAEVPDIDIFIDGHSHTAMVDGKPVDTSISLAEHNGLIASTGEYIDNIGVIVISEAGIEADLIPYAEDMPIDETIDALIKGIEAQQDEVLKEVVGTTSVVLDGARETNRKQETNLGNLAADAFVAATGADMAFTNGGGIRETIEAGDITKKDLVSVFPFGNYVVTKEVTGQAILEAMEHGVKDYPELSGGFPQVSGIAFELDESAEAGSRVKNATINGAALDPSATYLVATNDFIAAGGDDYTMFASFAIANEFGAMEEILIEFIKENPDYVAAVEGRIVVVAGAEEAVEEEPEAVEEETVKEEVVPEEVQPEEPVVVETTPEPPVVETPAGTTVYVVVAGDNLWRIAREFTGSGDNWNTIYELNRDTIQNPNMIYIGQELIVPAK